MPDPDLRVGTYTRVSGEQQAKEDTIASQIEAVDRRVAADGFECDPELCFTDDGYSGESLLRPGLERLRDQAAAGALDRLYALDPDRFSRKYAYQILILEELTRCGVEVAFLHNPPGRGPEQELLLQVQGMIAEYERAKILERCRRGKQYAARRGSVNVLSGAPYGYRYIDRHEGDGAARYQVLAEEARVVRKVFEWVGQQRCSIAEVCRRLGREGVATRTGKSAWDRSVVWAILRNPAYKGAAAFGKTRSGPLKPQRLRPQRGRPVQPRRPVTRVETPAEDRTSIAVPALVGEGLFEAVQAQLEEDRRRRRDRAGSGPYLLQGLVVCKRCGYGCYGKPVSRASARGEVRYAYYRCTGSDAYRFGGQRLCWNKQVRTDLLDDAVWEDVRRLLSEPERVRAEYERRLRASGGDTSPDIQHVNKSIANVKKMISRLIDAYGEGLLERAEFEPRISAARERLAKLEGERRERMEAAARESELRLVIGQLEAFAARVSEELREPDWEARRAIVRALVKQVELDEQEVRIVYRVSPPPSERGPQHSDLQRCRGRADPPLRRPLLGPGRARSSRRVGLDHRAGQPHADQPQRRAVGEPPLQALEQRIVGNRLEVRLQVRVVHLHQPDGQVPSHRVDRLMGVPARTEPVGTVREVRLEDRRDDQQHGRLHDPVLDRGDAQRPGPAVRLGDGHPLDRPGPVALGAQFLLHPAEEGVGARSIDDVPARLTIHPRGAVVLEHQPPRGRQHVEPVDPVVQGVGPELRLLLGLPTQLPPQLGDSRRRLDPGLDLRGHSRRVSRSGTIRLVPADLLASGGCTSPAGGLGSTGVTPLRRDYAPLRLPSGPEGGYGFPPSVRPARCHGRGRPGGASQVPRLICRRPPSPPTPESPAAACARYLTAGVRLHPKQEAGRSQDTVSRGRNGFTCVTAGAFAFSGFDGRVAPAAAESASWRTSNSHGQYLATDEINQAWPGALFCTVGITVAPIGPRPAPSRCGPGRAVDPGGLTAPASLSGSIDRPTSAHPGGRAGPARVLHQSDCATPAGRSRTIGPLAPALSPAGALSKRSWVGRPAPHTAQPEALDSAPAGERQADSGPACRRGHVRVRTRLSRWMTSS